MIVGIDPGASTGIAIYHGGKLASLHTIEPHQLESVISTAGRVVYEDSRLISHMFTTVKSRPAALKMARNVGEIDAWCKLIVAICDRKGIPVHGISPKHKGAKLDAAQFKAATGWTERSNQHERDAAMVAWTYRGAK